MSAVPSAIGQTKQGACSELINGKGKHSFRCGRTHTYNVSLVGCVKCTK